MLVLFDQATPVQLRPYLNEHTVRTAFEQGWDRLTNAFEQRLPGSEMREPSNRITNLESRSSNGKPVAAGAPG